MKEGEGKQLVECVVCGVLVGSVYGYHKHNVRQHSLAQLSRALIKLRDLRLPLEDPGEESATDGDDEDVCARMKDPLDILRLPVKVEVMDEVIELGPTDNADHLQVQSRLLNSSEEVNQHSSQVIEVKENNPPPCHLSALKDDPNAITVKFNKELVIAKDNSRPTVTLPEARRKVRERNSRVLRATFKSSIDIPNPESFIVDYQKAMSHASEKYIMQNIDPSAPVPKKKRGRPRKNPEDSTNYEAKVPYQGGSVRDRAEEEEDAPFIDDPPLFSNGEDEEDDSAAIPNIAKTRSGRTVKHKKEDGTFRYYDMPGRPQLGAGMRRSRQWEEESFSVKKSRRGRKRKVFMATTSKKAAKSSSCSVSVYHEHYDVNTHFKAECDVEVNEEDIQSKDDDNTTNETIEKNYEQVENMNISCKAMKHENPEEGSTTMTVEHLNESVCFLCFKVFSCKEECEKHMCEHLSKVTTVESGTTSHHEHQEHSNVDMTEMIALSSKDLQAGPEEVPNNTVSGPEEVPNNTVSGPDEVPNNTVLGPQEVPNNTVSGPEEVPNNTVLGSDEVPNPNNTVSGPEEVPNNTVLGSDEVPNPNNTGVSPFTTTHSNDKKEESSTTSVNKVMDSQVSSDSQDNNAHDCNICGKKYQTRLNLQSHIRKYHEETEWMKFRCATCGKSFGFLIALERHMKEHNPNRKFCCEQCGKVFKNLTNLKNHIPLHTRDEVFRCPYCPKNYYIRYSYEKHVRSHIDPPKFQCEICNKNFHDRKYFELHLERHQNGGCLGRSKDFRCNNCWDIKTPGELDIISEADLGHHKTCLVCGKGHYKKFMLETADSASLQEKTEKEREPCKLCGKFVINLMRHVKLTHLENSYIPCDVCGALVSKGSLPSHKNRKHGGSAVTCDHCNKVFKNIMCLREHMTKVRRKRESCGDVCKVCNEWVSAESWKEHVAKHAIKCSECGLAEFRNHDDFLTHLEACRKCSNCGTVEFATREDYLAHVEMCGSSIDIMTGSLDAANDQEVVTSIFAIVDESTCCGTCGEDFEDQLSLANHITERHPD